MTRPVTFAYPFDNHRTTPLSMIGPFTDALHAGGIDELWLWDELSGWFPGQLWRAENTPAAGVIDSNATYDPFVQAAFALAHNPSASVRLSTDAVRTQPAELLRRMLTLAHNTTGNVTLAIGAGELRQTKPFGYKRSEGLKRLEDVFVLLGQLYDATEPFNYEGNFWTYKNAFMGLARPEKRPEFWALGGGPILLDIAARYADGFEVASPQSTQTPEQFARVVAEMREKVAGYGRDPDAFGFGIWNLCVCHDDPDVIAQVIENPLIKYFGGQFGRLDTEQWKREGFTPVMPDGWHYAMKWAPFEQGDEEVQRIVDATSTEMSRRSYHVGTPDELAEINREFVKAGARFIGHLDMTPLVLGPADAQDSVRRAMQIAAAVKETTATAV
jgi:phthiodiolone/phenolphthiodiolone dimycocerosates ketoreductase